jgi:hypothetical protein
MPRKEQYAGPFRGGLDQLTDPTFVNLGDFTEAFNAFARNGNVQKRTGFSRQFTLEASGVEVSFSHQFVTRGGSRYHFAFTNGILYKVS